MTSGSAVAWAAAILISLPACAAAQGVSTAGLRGRVHSGAASVVARIAVTHKPSGTTIHGSAANGRFFIEGLEPGGPYVVTANAIGFRPEHHNGIVLKLGELREMDFDLSPLATSLDTITVVAKSSEFGARADGGTGTTIPAAIFDRLPTLNRDFYDFVRLVPQISTKISLANPGISGGGVGFRYNNFFINGVSDRTLSGNVSSSFAGVRPVPLDAVQEYQVLLAPYDARFGDFAGALVNAVTRSGTNKLRGGVFVNGRNDDLARYQDSAATTYQRLQYGLSLGGPIVRNRLHFFAATELVHYQYPAPGPYVGQPQKSPRAVPVSVRDLDRLESIMKSYGLSAGSGGLVQSENPTRNLFARFDVAVPEINSRIVVWNNYATSRDLSFSRVARDTFSLSSSEATRRSRQRTTALRMHTTLRRSGGGSNELIVSDRADGLDLIPILLQPPIRVAVPSVSGGRITINSGAQEPAQGSWVRSAMKTIRNALTVPVGTAHVITLGGENEWFRLRRGVSPGSFGSWSFASLDDFAAGLADVYQLRIDLGNSGSVVTGTQLGAFASDNWQVTERLSITAGMRADRTRVNERAPYEARVESLFGRRTDAKPPRRIEISPRLGFVFNSSEKQVLRGGVGVFTGRYPIAWIQTALLNYGAGGVLACGRMGRGMGPPPDFNPDYQSPPRSCSNGATITDGFSGEVDILNPNLRMTSVVRSSIALDRVLRMGVNFTGEALFTRARYEPVFENLNLGEPRGVDLHGRVMYGAFQSNGLVNPQEISRRSAFIEVIDLRSDAHSRSYQLSGRLEKRSSAGIGGSLAYTFTRARDAQTPVRVNTSGRAAWASARVVSGRHDVLNSGISSNEIPHRVVLQGIYAFPRSRTELSFYYVGESGRPFTYTAFGTGGRGDLNADGSNSNDPIYVPRNAGDTAEIRWSGMSDSTGADSSAAAQSLRIAVQTAAFENRIETMRCLRRQRGKILERNTCREPWSNSTIASVRHTVPLAKTALEIQLDAFNPLSLISSEWGARREAAPALLEHTGQTPGTSTSSRPIFRFNTSDPRWTTLPVESAFQLQLAVRYRF